jgi:hypothetical protein
VLLAIGWGSTGASGSPFAARGNGSGPEPTLRQLMSRPGPDVSLVAGTQDYSIGRVRVSFLVIKDNAQAVNRPRARVWLARCDSTSGSAASKCLDATPFEQTVATLEPIGVPGKSGPALGGVDSIYVAHLLIAKPGLYWLLAEPIGGSPIQAVGNLQVKAQSSSPAIGSKAFPSRTPTIASTHGDFAKLTTASPPDRSLLRYSIAGSLAAHKPFVVVFATPKFCTSRTCGPVVDVVQRVQQQLRGSDVRFIHVEVYKDNDPTKGLNRWFTQWHLPSEPWIFLVGADGRIKAKFEASVSVDELAAAVRRYLT